LLLSKVSNSSLPNLKSPPKWRALTSSGVMAFAGLGDAILYPVLPVYAEKLGIPLLWVGLLLSINRFVRIVANTWVANAINTIGMKKVLFISSCFAVITTFFYGLKLGLTSFIIARIIWGLSYSGLKTVTLNYAAKVKTPSGPIFGLTQSIKSMGALVALWMGPILIDYAGIEKGLFTIAGISVMAILLTLTLPNTNYNSTSKVETKHTFAPTPINLLINILAISIDGILVVVLANLMSSMSYNTEHLLVLVASYLLLKRLFMVGVSFVSGFLTLKISPIKIFNLAIISCVLGLLLIAFNQMIMGIIATFFFNTIIVTFSPLIAIQQHKKVNSLQIISSVSTWWDLGAGIGAFFGLILITKIGQQYLFIMLAILITSLFTNFIIHNAKTNRAVI